MIASILTGLPGLENDVSSITKPVRILKHTFLLNKISVFDLFRGSIAFFAFQTFFYIS